MALMMMFGSMFFSRARTSMFCARLLLLLIARLLANLSAAATLRHLDDVRRENIRIRYRVLRPVEADEGHVPRRDTPDAPLEVDPAIDGLLRANAHDLAA